MACLTNPISQPSVNISPIWIPLSSNEVSHSKRGSVWRGRFFMGFHTVSVASVQFYSTDGTSGRYYMSSQVLIHFFALVIMHRFLPPFLSQFHACGLR
jgi:hypothetical protein